MPWPRVRSLFRWVLASAVLVLIAAVAGTAWLVGTESGGAFLAARLSAWSQGQLQLSGWHGRLLDDWQVDRLRVARPDLHLDAQSLRVRWHPLALRQRALIVDTLAVDRLEIRTPPSSTAPQLPGDLRLPLTLSVAQVQIEQLAVGSLVPGATQPAFDVALNRVRAGVESRDGSYQISGLALESAMGRLGGELRLGAQAPFPLNLQLKLMGAVDDYRAALDIAATGSLAETRVRIDARSAAPAVFQGHADLVVQAFAPMPLREARLSIVGLDPAAFHVEAPHAQLDIEANLVPSLPPSGKTAPADWRVRGPLRITNHAPAPIEDGLPVQRLAAELDWAAGQLKLSALSIQLAGKGQVSGALDWAPVAGSPLGQAQARLTLKNVDPAQLSRRARSMRIGGTLTLAGGAQEQGFALDLQAEKMQLAARGAHRKNTLYVEQASLKAFDAQADFSGALGLTGEQAFTVQGQVARLDPHVFVKEVPEGALSASFSAAGGLKPAPAGRFSLTLSPSRFAGYSLEGQAQARFTPQRLFDADIDLLALGNRLRAQGAFGATGDTLALQLDAPHLERFGHELGGSLQAEAHVQGSLEQPTGDLRLSARQLRAPGGWRLARAEANGTLRAGAQGALVLKAALQELTQADGDKAQVWLKTLDLDLAGTRDEHTLTLTASAADTKLEARAAGGLQGTHWRGRLLGLGTEGSLALVMEKPATLEISADRVSLGEARLLSPANEHGRIELLHTEWTPEQLHAKGRLTGVSVGLTLDEYQRTVFGGRSLQLGAEWDLALADNPRGLVRLYREGGDFVLQGDAPVALGLENLDVNLAIDQGRLAISALANGSRIGAFNAVATLALKGRGGQTRIDTTAPMVGVVNADMPSISWLGPLADQNLRTAGSLRGQFNITGTPEKPVGAGFLKGDSLGLTLSEQGLRLDRGKMLLNFDANRVSLESFEFRSDNRMPPPDRRLPAQVAEGALRGSGEIALPSGKGRFQLALDHVAALQHPGQWLVLSGDAQLTSGWDQLDITARLKGDAGFIGVAKGGAPRLSEDVVIRGRQKPPQRLKLNADIGFDFGDDFILKAYGIDTWLDGRLQLKLAQGKTPRATGSIRTREGLFNAYGQRLEIERGAVNFHGPLDDPALNIVALRKGLEVEAGVEVTGSAQRPKVRLVSIPSVPEQEKLAWILFGRPSEGSAADIGVLLSAAGANFGNDGEGLGARVASGFGLDSVGIGSASSGPRRGLQSSVANNATAGNATPGATNSSGSSAGETMSNQVVTVGKRLSTRAYLSFEQNFLGTESVVKLSYALTRFISVVARAGTDNGLDLNYAISFR
jgi:translocation and assembly module TamB